MKHCIFHYPSPISHAPNVGSALRPNRMLAAFKAIGYEVEEITGYSDERKEKIKKVKEKIRQGVSYDFVYSESVNSPTLMTDADHLPRHPFMDFSFFRFCRKRGIPVGLFYRDMQWRFPLYKEAVSFIKRLILIPMFQYDVYMYGRCLDMIFLPSKALSEFIPPHLPYDALPPGGHMQEEILTQRMNRAPAPHTLKVFYVGSVTGGIYNLENFCKAVKETEGVHLTICTHESQWLSAKAQYAPYLCDRISVVHLGADQLAPYYAQADVFCCCLANNAYTGRAVPIKVFESIGYGVPVLITADIAAADYIRQGDCGWSIPDTAEGMKERLFYLLTHPKEVREKTANTVLAAPHHTWESRARQAAETLKSIQR